MIFFVIFHCRRCQRDIQTETGNWALNYNAANRPTDFSCMDEEGNFITVKCDYDFMGRRVFKKVISGTGTVISHQRFIYRGYLQIACVDLTRSNHPALWLITWDPTQPIATRPLAIQKDGTWYTYGLDLTKNVCEVFGATGYIRTAYTHSPFGSVTATGNVTQPIQWSSEFYDEELGLDYYNYRHYTPVDGRWLGRDCIIRSNLYLYSDNIPLLYCDFLGRDFYNPIIEKNLNEISKTRKVLAYTGTQTSKGKIKNLFKKFKNEESAYKDTQDKKINNYQDQYNKYLDSKIKYFYALLGLEIKENYNVDLKKCEFTGAKYDMIIVTEIPADIRTTQKGKQQMLMHEKNRAIAYKYLYDSYIKKIENIKCKISNKNKKNAQILYANYWKNVVNSIIEPSIAYLRKELGTRMNYEGINSDNKHVIFRNGNKTISLHDFIELYTSDKSIKELYELDGMIKDIYTPVKPTMSINIPKCP